MSSVAYGSPDYLMLAQLEWNVYRFSAAKSWTMCQQLSGAIRHPDGRLRSFSEFQKEAANITDSFVGAWLHSEYDHVVGVAQMSAKWVRIQADKATLPTLIYSAVRDSQTRPKHAELDGVAKPVDDPFWRKYYAPWEWGCRCDVLQSDVKRSTPDADTPSPEVAPAFKEGNATTGHAFPAKHPYYEHVPDRVLSALEGLTHKAADFYEVRSYRSGGNITMSKLVNKHLPDFGRVMGMAEHLAEKEGWKVEILPELPDTDPRRATILPGVKEGRNPDYRINGQYADLKTASKATEYNYLRRIIRDVKRQAGFAVIQLTDSPEEVLIEQAAKSKLAGEEKLTAVYIVNSTGRGYYYKK